MHHSVERKTVSSGAERLMTVLSVTTALESYLSVVGDAPADVLHPLAVHGAEAYLQLLRDNITTGTQPATHLHQHLVISHQCIQDLVTERANKDREDKVICKYL